VGGAVGWVTDRREAAASTDISKLVDSLLFITLMATIRYDTFAKAKQFVRNMVNLVKSILLKVSLGTAALSKLQKR
jgi:hypothetical protein